MFREMFLPIIRSTGLYLQYLAVFTQVTAGWCLEWVETELRRLWRHASQSRYSYFGIYSFETPAGSNFLWNLPCVGWPVDGTKLHCGCYVADWTLVAYWEKLACLINGRSVQWDCSRTKDRQTVSSLQIIQHLQRTVFGWRVPSALVIDGKTLVERHQILITISFYALCLHR
jgi:hypothetical protein